MLPLWSLIREAHSIFFPLVNILTTFYMGACLKETFEINRFTFKV